MAPFASLRHSILHKQPSFIKAGYSGYTRWSFITITLFNMTLASLFLLLSSPLIVLIAIAIKIHDGGPVFYKGVRLGRYKKPFVMYKLRTLPVNAQQVIGTEVLSPKSTMVTPFTRFLRDTRVDELPQLINVLRGDMDFVGPRPVRPEVYEAHCRQIHNYNLRFIVRPGLIGYAQIFTPHSSPKRIRAIIDNKFVQRKRSLTWDIFFISYTMFILLKRLAIKAIDAFWNNALKVKILHKYTERRLLERIKQRRTNVVIFSDSGQTPLATDGHIVDINYTHFKMQTSVELEDKSYAFLLTKQYTPPLRSRLKTKKAYCTGTITKRFPQDGTISYVVQYEPRSELNRYIIDQYMLLQSIATVATN